MGAGPRSFNSRLILLLFSLLCCCFLIVFLTIQYVVIAHQVSPAEENFRKERLDLCDVGDEGGEWSFEAVNSYAECVGRLAGRNPMVRRALVERVLGNVQSVEPAAWVDGSSEEEECHPHNCFNYSRCPLSSPLRVYLHGADDDKLDPFIRASAASAFRASPYYSGDANRACLYFVLTSRRSEAASELRANLQRLDTWRGSGRNHILLNLVGNGFSPNTIEPAIAGRAMIAQSTFQRRHFRHGFDIVAPVLAGDASSYDWRDTPSQVPTERRYFLTFQGAQLTIIADVDVDIRRELGRLAASEEHRVHIELGCAPLNQEDDISEWQMCSDKSRSDVLKQSTYALIIAPGEHLVSTGTVQRRLHEALRHGAIPVVLGNYLELPFAEFITWEKAVLTLPKARVSELYTYLSSIQDGDVLSMRRQGWFLWTTYLSSTSAVVNGILATLRTRLSIPAHPVRGAPSPSVFAENFTPLSKKVPKASEFRKGDFYPSPDGAHPSPRFLRNFTSLTVDRERTWNNFPGPFRLFPHTPSDPILPTDVQFETGLADRFEPLGNGLGARGRTFQESLGGNHPTEQFTIVMLSYERLPQIISLLNQINGLPYLNKVLVIWNSRRPPPASTVWPEIHVPFKVVNSAKNSLNNRFLPYDDIETEAVMTVDEDVTLNHDETILAFRIWREARDRIVGLPGRVHNWDSRNKGFMYGMTSSCEFSMVLTGSAFFHIYYAYVYSYMMPQVIRDKVDEYMNCEDITMNFLVSHITRKPPIKVTGRVYFVCPACRGGLSASPMHYRERHTCTRFLTKVYGYTSLLFTQYRADSALFNSTDVRRCYNNV